MRSEHFPISIEEFKLLPRRPGWKYEYWDGHAHLSPGHQTVSVVLEGDPLRASERQPAATCDPALQRPVERGDLPELAGAYLAAFRETIDFCDWPEARIEEQARQDLEGFFAGRRGEPLAASRLAVDGAAAAGEPRLVGAVLVLEVAPETALLDLLFVVPAWQRRGLATALLGAALQELKARGFTRLESRYHLGNEASGAWHRRCGFVEEPDLFLAQSMLRHAHHELWRHERLGHLGAAERAALEAECERRRVQVEELEARGRREGMEAVLPLLRHHRRSG
jgi:RimJ/RimL family protein N-acetyltransferase